MDQYIGKLLDNRYEILEVVGTGGMAVVYKARCHRLNRLVAVKILKSEIAQDEELRRLARTGLPASPALDAMLAEKGEPPAKNGVRLADLLRRPNVTWADLRPFDPDGPELSPAQAEQVEISLKYEGYIQRQDRQLAEFRRLEEHPLPPELDYSSLQGLRLEARQKLSQIRPLNLGQASRISGVSPADVAALMVYLEKK